MRQRLGKRLVEYLLATSGTAFPTTHTLFLVHTVLSSFLSLSPPPLPTTQGIDAACIQFNVFQKSEHPAAMSTETK